jgi:hypothetical protein
MNDSNMCLSVSASYQLLFGRFSSDQPSFLLVSAHQREGLIVTITFANKNVFDGNLALEDTSIVGNVHLQQRFIQSPNRCLSVSTALLRLEIADQVVAGQTLL